MGSFPESPRSDFLHWCQAHAPIFTAHATAIGMSSGQATKFADAVTKAADQTVAQETARVAAKTATERTSEAYGDLREKAADAIRTIRTFALNSSNPNTVYDTAQIPAPVPPSAMPPPGEPSDLRFELAPTTGELTLRWKCTNPPGANGTSYIIRRKLPGDADFSFLGVAGAKKFIDTTLIAGPDWVQYCVQGQRSGLSGPVSNALTINFGRAPGGGMSVTSSGMSQVAAAQNAGALHESNGSSGAFNANGSTVNGQPVQKVLPGSHASRNRS